MRLTTFALFAAVTVLVSGAVHAQGPADETGPSSLRQANRR